MDSPESIFKAIERNSLSVRLTFFNSLVQHHHRPGNRYCWPTELYAYERSLNVARLEFCVRGPICRGQTSKLEQGGYWILGRNFIAR